MALRAGSSMVPHMPQNRKLVELTSPHFGQIKVCSPTSVFLSVLPKLLTTGRDAHLALPVAPFAAPRQDCGPPSILDSSVQTPMARKPKPGSGDSRSFTAPVVRLRSNLGWIVVWVPFDVEEVWGKGGRPKIKGDINGYLFRTSLFPTRDGKHFILVNKRMQKGGHAFEGTMARVRLEPDLEERTVTIPAELKSVLSEERALLWWFEKLNYSTQKWITDWVSDPKGHDARLRRSEQVAEQMMSTMEAEKELPPVLQVAFARNPRAREGWEQWSPTQRRGQLLAIFYYRTPDSRAKRLAKVVEEAAAYADKKAAKRQS